MSGRTKASDSEASKPHHLNNSPSNRRQVRLHITALFILVHVGLQWEHRRSHNLLMQTKTQLR